MAGNKIYAGAKLKEMRTRLTLTQAVFAQKLGVSLPYLNQMENNNRPVSTTVVLALASEFGLDVTELNSSDAARLVADMAEVTSDPVFGQTTPSLADIRLVAANAPGLARSFLDLHQAYKQGHDRLAVMEEALGRDGAAPALSPWEEVRDFFHYCDNYVDAVDRAAERIGLEILGDPLGKTIDLLAKDGIQTAMDNDQGIRRYDPETNTLSLSSASDPATRAFQTLHQYALIKHEPLLDACLDLAQFKTDESRAVAKIGMANYFAGAALMPYGAFLDAAMACRHDLQILADKFGASLEQVAHRLSTMQRPQAKGIPFFFVRVDQAGTITKRHSATRLQFARFGGACPLWNVHQAFETPGRFIRQLAETPDDVRYLCLARDVTKTSGAFHVPNRRYAIGLGCEISHASDLVYADDLDLNNDRAYERIGVSCRICPRPDCHQRSVPPLENRLSVDKNNRGVLAYEVLP